MDDFDRVVEGDRTFDSSEEIRGILKGSAYVLSTGALTLKGIVTGSIRADHGAHVTVYGICQGDVISDGGRIEIYGVVNGMLFGSEADFHIDPNAIAGRPTSR